MDMINCRECDHYLSGTRIVGFCELRPGRFVNAGIHQECNDFQYDQFPMADQTDMSQANPVIVNDGATTRIEFSAVDTTLHG